MTHVFDNLYPAIVQCFGVVLIGYITGRLNLVTSAQSKGLSIFVSHFALPGIILKSLIKLDFSSVNWTFLSGILLGKAIVFLVVIFFSLLLLKPRHLGKCGLYAIFATQSNDFGIGYPIVMALYGQTHPGWTKYIALVVPISFLILNPIGYILLEIEKRRSSTSQSGKCTVIAHIVKGVLMNPVVLFTIIGISANLILSHNVPTVVEQVIDEFANAFSATALFYLGLSMVGKVSSQLGKAFVPQLLLIFAKMILLPLTIREVVVALDAGSNANETIALANFGFLYGTFPTAPTVFIYANMYAVAANMVASAMVVCTFVSAPLMFVSARMVSLKLDVMSMSDYANLLTSTSFDICILSIVCMIWVGVVFALSRRYRTIPHQFTLLMLVSHFLACLGMLLFSTIDKSVLWPRYIEYIVSLIGILSTRCWTAAIALTICLLKTRSLCFVLRVRAWLVIACFGIPTLSTGLLMIFNAKQRMTDVDPMFQYGQSQVILSAVILTICLVVTIACLVVEHRSELHRHSYRRLRLESTDDESPEASPNHRNGGQVNRSKTDTSEDDLSHGDHSTQIQIQPQTSAKPPSRYSKQKPRVYGATSRAVSSDSDGLVNGDQSRMNCGQCDSDIEDLSTTLSVNLSTRGLPAHILSSDASSIQTDPLIDFSCREDSCSEDQRLICVKRLSKYGVLSPKDEVKQLEMLDCQIVRHQLMLLLQCISMFTGLVLCLWRLLKEDNGGVYIELEFIDAVFNFGQGFIVFAFFGMDTKLIIMPFLKTWRRIWYGVEEIHLPNVEDLDEEIVRTCYQFMTYHKDLCERELVRSIRYRLRVYRKVFTGEDLTDWLLKVGLAEQRQDAIAYGRRLLIGRVLHHVTREYLFYDLPYYYRFNDNCSVDDFECPLTGDRHCGRLMAE